MLLNFKLTKHIGFMCDSEQIHKLKSYALAEVAKRPEDQNMTRFPQDVWYAVGNEDEQTSSGRSSDWPCLVDISKGVEKCPENVPPSQQRRRRRRLITRRRGRGLRLFSLVPIGKLRQKHILVDTDALHDLYQMADMEVPPKPEFRNQADVWWRRAFDVDSVTTANRRFGYSLSTDGVQVSLHLMKPFQEAEVNDWGFDLDGAYYPLEVGPNTNVVGLDGGRRCLYTTVSGEGRDDEQMCRNVRWQEISGSTYAKKKKAVWMRHDPQMQAWITLIPTPRCMTHDAYHAHLTHFLGLRNQLLGFYRDSKWRRLRWKTRIKRQKAYDQIAQELSNGNEDTIIAYGGGSFDSSSRGHPPTPTKHLFVELKRRFKCRLIPEYRTSQVCSNCDGQLTQTRFWAVKECQNLCLTLWNRDVNAARNISRVFLYRNEHNGERPEQFRPRRR
ncbi:hypothetical protein MIR68_006730 [Amoeboaphelidium protococcarum]|nr:hypothetical protein MIR68_006730 [Amoeboaphelidium protococcarum]